MGIDIYSIALDYPDTIIQVKASDLVEAAHVFMADLALGPERETRGRKSTKETSEPSNPKTLLTKREVMKLIALKKKHSLTLLVISHTPKRNLSNPITQNDLAGSKKLYNFFDNVFAIGQSAKDKRIKFVKQVKVRASEYVYDSDNVIVYEITNEDGYVRFLHKGYGKEAEHLKDKTEDDEYSTHSNILALHREGKSVREIADLVDRSKTSVHRIIAREKRKEGLSPAEAVPGGDAGQLGQVGQAGQCGTLDTETEPGESFVFDLYEDFDAL
mgnify:CR=1 FL=1